MLQHQLDSRQFSPPNKSSLTEALSKRKTTLPISTPTIPEENPIAKGSLLTTPTFSTDQYSPQKYNKDASSPMVSTFFTGI